MIGRRGYSAFVVGFSLSLSGGTEARASEKRAANPTPTPPPSSSAPPASLFWRRQQMAHHSFSQSHSIGNAVSDPDGPIGSYTWQIATTSAFTTIIASGFTNMDSDPSVPTRTADKVSGLPNVLLFLAGRKPVRLSRRCDRIGRFSLVAGAIVHRHRPRPSASHAIIHHAKE